jgi:UDP-3-O-[3-hydroxymyristoyl] glucosamine N-acyltransferase
VKLKLSEIVAQFGGRLDGDDVPVEKISSLMNASAGDISFFCDTKYSEQLKNTKADAVIVSEENKHLTNLPKIISSNPYAYFALLSSKLNPSYHPKSHIHSSATIDPSAKIHPSCYIAENVVIAEGVVVDEDVVIGANSYLGSHVKIGKNTLIDANVTIYHATEVGSECHLSSGVVIGSDGFGYAQQDDKWVKIPQIGKVVIGNNVDIGSNTSIDRGALDDTIIGDGVKMDNQIQIGHNCHIGEHTIIAGCVGIAGSAKIGKYCKFGGAAMILGHLEIANNVTVSPGSMITRSIYKEGTYTALMPFLEHSEWLKMAANIRKITELADKIKALEHQIDLLNKIQKDSL